MDFERQSTDEGFEERILDAEQARLEALAEYEERHYDGPKFSEEFPVGDRFAIIGFVGHPEMGGHPVVRNRGWVVGYIDGWIEIGGGMETGPGEPVEAELVVLKCDDGPCRNVNPANLQDDAYADENCAMWGTP